MDNKINIVVIDSGWDKNCKELEKMLYTECNVADDDIGHGTAILSILNSKIKNAHIYIYKLFSKDFTTKIDDLINALLYIEKHYQDVNIIHLSNGCVRCTVEEEQLLYNVCSSLTKKIKLLLQHLIMKVLFHIQQRLIMLLVLIGVKVVILR